MNATTIPIAQSIHQPRRNASDRISSLLKNPANSGMPARASEPMTMVA